MTAQALSALVILVVLALSAWAVTLAYDRPWFPSENITVDGMSRTGFVVNESNDVLTVLWNSDRSVVRISADSVDSRKLCRLDSNLAGRSMLSRIVWDEADYPDCGAVDEVPSEDPSPPNEPSEVPSIEPTHSTSGDPSPSEADTPRQSVEPSTSVEPTATVSLK